MQTTKICLLSISFLFVLAIGCSYKTLSIFFDGVPKPEEKKDAAQGPEAITLQKSSRPFKHAPYEAGTCDACHDPQKGHRLIAAREEICLSCHSFEPAKKYVHGPLASGDCLLCHAPHESQYPRLLVAEARTFCFTCHDMSTLPKDDSHMSPEIQCIECHDAHMSDNQFLLK